MDQINTENIDQWLFSNMEGDLSAQEIEELNNYLEMDPAMGITQGQWHEANFNAIEIEEYPRLKAIQKGRHPWWKKAWFFSTITMIASVLVLFYFFQYSNKALNFNELHGMVSAFSTKENTSLIISDSVETQMTETAPLFSEIATPPLRKKKGKVDPPIRRDVPFIPESADSVIATTPIEKTTRLELKKHEVFSFSPGELWKPSKNLSKPNRSKKQKRKFKKARRKEARKRFDQNAINGHDPKIIPLEGIGF